jgi:Tfp pilus assembly protein PilV
MNRFIRPNANGKGFSLLDVVIAIAVFSIGVLAMAQYQTSLVRSNLDARLRTMASNLAEETIETQRRFVRLDHDSSGSQFAYSDIIDATSTRRLGGVDFTISQTVTEYYWSKATQQFETTPQPSRPFSDFKLLEVSVSWENPLQFNIGGNSAATTALGTGNASISSIISSNVTAAGRLALIDDLSGNPLFLPLSALPPSLTEVVPEVELDPIIEPIITIPLLSGGLLGGR